jgi:hypothetical protein
MPVITGEITLGTLLTIVTLVSIAVGIGIRFGRIESKQDAQMQAMERGSVWMAKHDVNDDRRFDSVERQIADLVKTVYMLVGQHDQAKTDQHGMP